MEIKSINKRTHKWSKKSVAAIEKIIATEQGKLEAFPKYACDAVTKKGLPWMNSDGEPITEVQLERKRHALKNKIADLWLARTLALHVPTDAVEAVA